MKKSYETYFEYAPNTPRRKGKGASERNEADRIAKAMEQMKLPPKTPLEVEHHVRALFQAIGVKTGFSLKDKGDFIWIKFTKDNYVGVVAAGCDFNFGENTSSAKYIRAVNQVWQEDLILVFPISSYPPDKNRSDIERAVGNYLIAQGVPIIDFYSHNY